uniref:Uncharacterized protein n=1 Tax=Amazona collaria TaxID=241587 RepID=A0A8B9GKR5_9PSIT
LAVWLVICWGFFCFPAAAFVIFPFLFSHFLESLLVFSERVWLGFLVCQPVCLESSLPKEGQTPITCTQKQRLFKMMLGGSYTCFVPWDSEHCHGKNVMYVN